MLRFAAIAKVTSLRHRLVGQSMAEVAGVGALIPVLTREYLKHRANGLQEQLGWAPSMSGANLSYWLTAGCETPSNSAISN